MALAACLAILPACGDDPPPVPVPASPEVEPTRGEVAPVDPVPVEPAPAMDFEWFGRRPAVRLVLSGGQRGHLTPCGCRAPRLGGLPRTAAALGRLRVAAAAASTTLGVLGLGWTLPGNGEAQQEAMADLVRAAHESLGFSAALLGDTDLAVAAMTQPRGSGPEEPTPPLNVKLASSHPAASALRPWADFAVGPVSIRACSVIEPRAGEMLVRAGVADVVSSVSQSLSGLRPAPEAVWVVAARLEGEGTLSELQAGLPRLGAGIVVDVADSGQGRNVVDGFALKPGGDVLVVRLDRFGTCLGVLDFDPAPDGDGWVVAYRLVPLAPEWEKYGGPGITSVNGLEAIYRQLVRDRRYLAEFPRQRDEGPRFVGSSACAACHAAIYRDWRKTPHAAALTTLERADRHWDPACVRCHTVGWARDGDTWTAWRSGFRDPERTGYLGGVGCESCHGPGSVHVATPDVRTPWAPGRAEPAGATAGSGLCQRCHDAENDADFLANYAQTHLPAVDHHTVPADRRTVVPAAGGGR